MPGKQRRAAVRQAQLRQRRKRQTRGPSGIPSPGPPSADGANQTIGAVATQTPTSAIPTSAAPASSRSRIDAPRRSAGGTREARPLAHTYVGPELRRIGIFSGLILVILIVLTFVLR